MPACRSKRAVRYAGPLPFMAALYILLASFGAQASAPPPNDSLAVPAFVEALASGCEFAGFEAQVDEREALRRIERAMASGDIRSLFYSFSEQVEVMIHGEGSMYSRAQATYVMRDFFRAYPPEQFELDDVARARDSHIAMGEYWYRGEEQAMRVYLRMRLRDGRWELKELRIEQVQKR